MQTYSNSKSTAYDNAGQAHRGRAALYNQSNAQDRVQSNIQNYGYVHVPPSPAAYGSGNASLAALTQSFAGLSLPNSSSMSSVAIPAPAANGTGPRLNLSQGHGNANGPYVLMQNGTIICTSHGYGPQSLIPSPNHLGPGYPYDQSIGPFSPYPDLGHLGGYQHPTVNPQGQAFVPHSDGVPTELPGFGDRKSSMGSTNEREASSSPDTPYMSAASQVDQQVTIVRADHSPHVHYDYRTPSPQSGLHQYEQSLMLHSLAMHGHSLSKDSVSSFGPIIPPAITAVYESRVSRKSLEASLYNANRTTNVYIRGFPPETDDAMLLSYAANFGRVLTSKAMIDNQTGACKGFGFACFQTFQEAENCIRGFYGLGYDVSFARESFNARLKALSDPLSTNLYVSNLPRSMTEAELAAIFMGYTVESSRIQRDEHGNSKGVGFARFKTRKECDEVIEKFNGQLLGQERMPFQVRYADTQEQKRFKQVTQERRDFKSGEYNHVAYGPAPPSYYQLQHARAGSYSAMSRLPFGRRSNAHWAGYRHRNNVERARYALERIPKLELTSTRDALCDQKHASGDLSPLSTEDCAGVCVPSSPAVVKSEASSAIYDAAA